MLLISRPEAPGRRRQASASRELSSRSKCATGPGRSKFRNPVLLSGFLLIGCFWIACAGGPPADLSGAAAGWNVLLLSLDTVRADRLGAYGYSLRDTSPRIDDLIGSGVRFERAAAPRATTWPSLASVMTGLYPSGHGVIQNGYEFPDSLPTLPKILSAAGYRTGRFLSNMCRANHQGWDTGFCSRGVDGKINPKVFEWLDGPEGSQPYFLWVHYFAAHPPYYNGQEIARQLDPGYHGPVGPKKSLLHRIMQEDIPLDEADLRHLDAVYDAAVMGSDRTIGRLLDGLRQRGLLDKTLVILLSDHGEDLYDHNGYIYHACSVYQSGLHVPLAIVAPGLVTAGVEVPQVVELIDVAPTVVDLLGLEPPQELHGKSLVPHLERSDHPGPGRPAFTEFGKTRIRTVQAGSWKLVDNPDHHTPLCFDGAPADLYPIAPVELYDLTSDPEERTNLAEQLPDRVAALQELIERRFAGLTDRGGLQELPEDLKQELRALGYVAD
jgi:arylsulfatase A-like enzyme